MEWEVVWMPGQRLCLEEREFIQVGRAGGMSCRAMAAELGRPHTTVSREVRRNTMVHNNAYLSQVAQHRTDKRARRPKVFKLEANSRLARWVERKLRRGWSPRQISKQLRRDHPDDPRWWVSPEAIYASLYVQGRGGLKDELTQHLKSRRTSRRHGNGPGQIPDRVHFSLRPPEAKDRAVPGHWEGDLLLGTGYSQVAMLTERTTRYTMLVAIEARTAPVVREALEPVIKTLPDHLRRSLTWDNGKEMSQHVELRLAADIDIFFCDPGHPWQRGTAEQTIGLLRAYLPKKTDLSVHTQADLDNFAVMLNERPRETLDWRSPAEAYADLLAVQ